MEHPTRTVWALAAAAATAGFALYAYTAAPDLTLVDSAELALAVATGGVAHPPGFPLYLLVGRVFTALPVETPARALNLMSAFWMALAGGAVFVACERAIAWAIPTGNLPRLAGGAIAATAFLTARNPWTWSAVTEVYALNAFLLASGWAAAWTALTMTEDRSRWTCIVAASVFAALGLANHHATALLLFPVLLLMVAIALPRVLRSPRLWAVAAGSVAGAIALYLYLLVAAVNDPGLGWGGVTSLSLLVRHVTGQQYSLQVGSTPGESLRVVREFGWLLFFGAGIPTALLVLGGAPLAIVGGRARRARWLVLAAPLAMIVLNLLLSANYIAGPEDRMAYDLPATVAWALLAGIGAAAIAGRLAGPLRLTAVVLGGGVVMVWNVVANFDACNMRTERTARVFVSEVLEQVPEQSLVVTTEWNFYAPFLYMKHLEGYRSDLEVIDSLMMRRFWYLDYVERTCPRSIAGSRAEFDAFREQVTRFDLGQPYDAGAIQALYDGLLRRWVELGVSRGGAFVDWASLERAQEVGWIRSIATLPEGLLVRFVAPHGPAPPEPIADKDAANLAWVRSKITDRTVRGDLLDHLPRHDPYRKVWSFYQKSVHASLLWTSEGGGDAGPLIELYARWYPEMPFAIEVVRARLPVR